MPLSLEEFLFGESGVLRLIFEGEYAQALQVIQLQGEQFPEVARTVQYHRICLTATLGDTAQALEVLRERLAAGVYYPALLLGAEAEPPGLAPLQGLPEFEKLKAAHQERYQEAMENAEPVLVSLAPQPTPAGAPPLLFAMHGNVSRVENELDFYRPVTEWGWLLAMPQSSQPWGMEGRFVWGDWQLTESQLKKYWARLSEQAGFDPSCVVTAGISKGGEVALWLALSGTIQTRGFVAIAPGGPLVSAPEKLLPWLEQSREQGLRGYLIVGEQDAGGYEGARNLAAFFKQQGFPCELETHPQAGHWFPPDFERSLQRALAFVTG